MSTSVVIRGILLPTNNLLGVVKLTVRTTTDLITDRGFQIDVDGTWDVLPSTRLTEEGIEGIIPPSYGLVGGHLSIRLNAMLELKRGRSWEESENCRRMVIRRRWGE